MDLTHTPVLKEVLLHLGNKYRVLTGKTETGPDAVIKSMVDDFGIVSGCLACGCSLDSLAKHADVGLQRY